jgi:preprotein translocase subunit SecF
MIRFGYHYSIDFVGGTTLQYSLSRAVDPAKVKALLKTFPSEKQVVEMNGKQLTIRLDAQKGGNEDAIYSAIKSELDPKVVVLQAQTVGPTLGAETIRKTLIAALMGVFVIFAYIAFAFKGVRFATAAIVALLHDMAYEFFPQEFLKQDLYKLQHWTRESCTRSQKLIAVSKKKISRKNIT